MLAKLKSRMLHILLNLAMVLLIFIITTATPNRFFWGYPFTLTIGFLSALVAQVFTTHWFISVVALILLLVPGVMLHRYGYRRFARTLQRILLGDGWAGWAMFWLWMVALIAITQPAKIVAMAALGGSSDEILLSPLVAAIVGLIIFQRAALKHEGFPMRAAIVGLVCGIGVFIVLDMVLLVVLRSILNWTQLFGVTTPAAVLVLGAGIVRFPLNLILVLVIVCRRVGFTVATRVLLVVLVGGMLASIALLYPLYSALFVYYVPSHDLMAPVPQQITITGAIVSSLVLLIAGSAAVWAVRPQGFGHRLGLGALVGVLLGLFVFAVLGTWFAGSAAQSPLYGFAYTREGYNDAEWTLLLGIAVNNVFPASSIVLAITLAISTALSAIGAVVTPVQRIPQTKEQTQHPAWVRVILLLMPFIQSSAVVMVFVLGTLDEAIRNIFTNYGYAAFWQPEWILPMLLLPQMAIMTLSQVAIITWLQRQLALTRILRNAAVFIGLLMLLSSAVMLLSKNWVSVFYAVMVGGFSLEMIRLSLTRPVEDNQASDGQHWVSDGLLAGSIGMLISYGFIGIALSLVLITVVLIVPLADASAPPPGMEFMIETLDTTIIVSINAALFALNTYLATGGIFGLVLALDVPGNIFRFGKRVVLHPRVTKRIPTALKRGRVRKYGTLLLALLFDLWIMTPLALSIWVWVYIRLPQNGRFSRLWIITLVVLIAAAVIVLNLAPDYLNSMLRFALLTATFPAAIVLVRLADGFVPPALRSRRHVMYIVALSLGFALVVRSGQTTAINAGGVSSFDGTGWTVYNQNNSTIGQGVHYAMVEDSVGNLWFANNGGIISTRTNDGAWNIGLIETDIAETSPSRTQLGGSRTSAETPSVVPHLTINYHNQVWFGMGDMLGHFAPDSNITGTYDYKISCEDTLSDACAYSPSLWVRDESILTMASLEGYVWAVTTKSILVTSDRGYQFYDLPAPTTHASISTAGDEVWVTTDSDILLYTLLDDRIPLDTASFPDDICDSCVIHANMDGIIWIASADGVWELSRDSEPQQVIAADQLQGVESVTALAVTDDTLWIGTSNRGLLRYADDAFVPFDSDNSGLIANHVRDILVDDDGIIWVTTFATQTPVPPGWLMLVGVIASGGFIGLNMISDYGHSPAYRAKRSAREIASSEGSPYANVYALLASEPPHDTLHLMQQELNAMSLPVLGGLIGAVASLKTDPTQVETLVTHLADDADDPALTQYYQMVQQALAVSHVSHISQLDLMVNPASETQTVTLTTRTAHGVALPSFVHEASQTVWLALSNVSLNLRKSAEVNDTGDRLSYLAAALASVEDAQRATQAVAFPDNIILKAVTERWRTLIGQVINVLSGSADLRVELRTRQVKRDEQVTLVIKVENIGRATAEAVRVHLRDGDDITLSTQMLDYLSPNRSQSLEFAITPATTDTQRVRWHVLWNDRMNTNQSLDYADEVRFYESAAQFVQIPNPYIVGHPVKSSQMFFGREDVFQFVEQNLSGIVQDRTIVLYGQRRTGKTSLLYQLVDGRLGDRFLAVLVDMQALVLLIETTADFLGEILYQIEQTLDQAGIAIDVPQIDSTTPSPNRVFNRFIDQLSRTLGERRLLIIFDEFELIEGKIKEGKLDRNLLDYFRSLIQHRDTLVFIFTGTHQLEEMSHDYWSILFNIALTRKISFLSPQDTEALIRQPIADALTVDDLAVEKLLTLTNGHPFFTQLLCWALVNHCNAARRNYATINDVNDAITAMLATGEAHFAYVWQQISEQAQLLLAAMAQFDHIWLETRDILDVLTQHGAESITRTDAIATLDALVRQEILESTAGGQLRYRYILGVQQIWVKRTKSLESLIERYG